MREGRAAALVVAAAVLWGTTGTAQALGQAESSPLSVGALRMAIGAAGLLAVSWHRLSRPPPGWLVLSAVCMAGYQVCFFSGVARVGVALGTVVALGSAPVMA
ncbi:MAG: DMT family transporter, partial [Acidimicrobiia bacterium]